MSHFDELLTKEPYRSIFDDGSAYKITPSGIERGHVEYDKRNGTSRWNSDKTISAKPFLPTAILDNQDEAVQKVEVSLWERNRWKQTVVNREVLCNSSKVSQLANMGFPVGSDNAKDVARYFNSILAEYDEKIPRHASRSVMGWAELDGQRVFMPYTDALSFDGEDAYKHLYDSISTLGTVEEWTEFMRSVRSESLEMRLTMAASFASPLIELIGENPFILHLWAETGSGKTVALMTAMSIWGDPQNGKMLRSLNMTMNSMLSTAAFLNSIPFAGDELQTLKNRWSKSYDQIIMQLTEGVDRGRMQNDRLLRTKSWRNAFIFSGEEPIIKASSGGGAVNRVVQIEVDSERKLTSRGNEVANFVRKHYGTVGPVWTEFLRSEQDNLRDEYNMIFTEILNASDTTDKQAGAMAILFLADNLASQLFWPDERMLQIKDVVPYLASKKQVDITERAYDYVVGMISENVGNFQSGATRQWGDISGDIVRINKTVLMRIMSEEGYDFDACKKKWAKNGKLMVPGEGRYSQYASVCGLRGHYVSIVLPNGDDAEQTNLTDYKGDMPF
jgi:uncharacterized protein (DUF927 family)